MVTVSFTSLTTVIKMLMLTSIDRPEEVFTLDSIIKFAQQGTDPYFAPPYPRLPSRHHQPREERLGLGREGLWNLDFKDVSHTQKTVRYVFASLP